MEISEEQFLFLFLLAYIVLNQYFKKARIRLSKSSTPTEVFIVKRWIWLRRIVGLLGALFFLGLVVAISAVYFQKSAEVGLIDALGVLGLVMVCLSACFFSIRFGFFGYYYNHESMKNDFMKQDLSFYKKVKQSILGDKGNR